MHRETERPKSGKSLFSYARVILRHQCDRSRGFPLVCFGKMKPEKEVEEGRREEGSKGRSGKDGGMWE